MQGSIRRLFLYLALFALPLLACGFGTGQSTAPSGQSAPSSAPSSGARQTSAIVHALAGENGELPPLLTSRLPDAPAQTLQQFDAHGIEARDRQPLQIPDLNAVLTQPHVALSNMLIGQDMRYFTLPVGWVSPDSRLHLLCQDEMLILRAVNGVESLFEALNQPDSCEPVWSPDSNRFAFFGAQGLAIYDVEQAILTAVENTQDATPLSWSPDSNRLLFRQQRRARVYSVDGPEAGNLETLGLSVNNLQQAVWSPDGNTIFVRDGRGAPVNTSGPRRENYIGAILTYDLATNTTREWMRASRLEGALEMVPAPNGQAVAVWHVSCRRVISELLPVLTLECEANLRVIDLLETETRTLTPEPMVMRSTLHVPHIVWLQWRAPVEPHDARTAAGELLPFMPLLLEETSRSPWQPVPLGQEFTSEPYAYTVTDVLRGAEATALMQVGAVRSIIAEPAPEYEHLAVRLRIRHLEGERINIGMAFFPRLVGENWSGGRHLILIDDATQAERSTFNVQGEVAIWVTFLIAKTEGTPVLRTDDLGRHQSHIYLAANDTNGLSAVLPNTPAIEPQPPNTVGLSEPAVPGETAITRNWQIRVVEVLEGEAFLSRRWLVQGVPGLLQTDPGALGQRIFAVRVAIGYQGNEAEFCSGHSFRSVGTLGFIAVDSLVTLAYPNFQLSCFYPGGQREGWLLMVAYDYDTEPVFIFEVPDEEQEAVRYFSPLAPGGAAVEGEAIDAPETDLPEAGTPPGEGPEADAPEEDEPEAGVAGGEGAEDENAQGEGEAAAPDTTPAQTGIGLPTSGQSRTNPLPVGQTIGYEGIDYRVLEVLRGEQAVQRVTQASVFNQPPPEDREYVLVRVSLENTGPAEQTVNRNDLALTGGAGILYRSRHFTSIGPVILPPLAAGETAEHWLGYEVAAGEAGLILVVPFPLSLNLRFSNFLAVSPEAGAATLPTVRRLSPDAAGLTLNDAVDFGEPIVTSRWQIQGLEMIRGEEAWDRIAAANPNNNPPTDGTEYILVRMRLYLQEERGDAPLNVTGIFLLGTVDEQGQPIQSTSVVPPMPDLWYNIFSGATVEGWHAVSAPAGQPVFLQFRDPSTGEPARHMRLP